MTNARSIGIPREVADQLGYYVYLCIDPRSGRPFYVGKGKGRRILHHLNDPAETHKTQMIARIRAERLEPRLEILSHRLPDEESAFRIEAAAIDILGRSRLTNPVRGQHADTLGRVPLSELITQYRARPAKKSNIDYCSFGSTGCSGTTCHHSSSTKRLEVRGGWEQDEAKRSSRAQSTMGSSEKSTGSRVGTRPGQRITELELTPRWIVPVDGSFLARSHASRFKRGTRESPFRAICREACRTLSCIPAGRCDSGSCVAAADCANHTSEVRQVVTAGNIVSSRYGVRSFHPQLLTLPCEAGWLKARRVAVRSPYRTR